jgi:anti-anti-sigma factor
VAVSEEFSVTLTDSAGFRVVVVRGEMDEVTAPELDGVLDRLQNGRCVIVDLSRLAFISSAGIHVLFRNRAASTAIVCPPGHIARVFDIVRVGRRVPVFDSMDHAIQSLTLSQSA